MLIKEAVRQLQFGEMLQESHLKIQKTVAHIILGPLSEFGTHIEQYFSKRIQLQIKALALLFQLRKNNQSPNIEPDPLEYFLLNDPVREATLQSIQNRIQKLSAQEIESELSNAGLIMKDFPK